MKRNNKIRVLISTGQGRLHLLESAKALESAGVDVKVVTGWVPSEYIPDVFLNFLGVLLGRRHLAKGLRKRSLGEFDKKILRGLAFPEFIIQILFILSKFKFLERDTAALLGWKLFGYLSKGFIKSIDIFHVRSGAGQGGAIRKAKKLGFKVVVDHSLAHPNEVYQQLVKAQNGDVKGISISPKSKFWKLVLMDCEEADVIQVNSEYVKDSFINNGFSEEKIFVVPLGIRKEFWSLKKDYQINNNLNLLFTGGFGRRKGGHIIINTIKKLREARIPFQLDVIGSFQYDLELPKWFIEDSNVKLHGHLPQEQLFSFLSSSDIYVFPSYSEGAAQSLKEAMAAGLPVIATKQSGAPIIDHINGILVKDGCVDSLFNAIKLLKGDGELRRKLGQNAAITIREHHTWENYALRTIEGYEKLLIQNVNGVK